MDLICPQCLGTLEMQDGQSARCTVHGGEFRVLFSRWQPPPPPAPPVVPTETQTPSMTAVPDGVVCVQHASVPAVFLCQNCSQPICAVCAFPVEGGGQICPNCFERLPGVRPATEPSSFAAPPPVVSQVPEGVRCVQHPHLPATRQCRTCGAFMCATCDFTLPGGIHLCPACATTPKTKLSPRRRNLLVGSFALAVWCTIGLAILLSGALADTVQTKEGEQAVGVALTFLLLIPAIIGMALGFSAVDRRLPNPPVLWIATIWNILIVGGFVLLCIVGSMK